MYFKYYTLQSFGLDCDYKMMARHPLFLKKQLKEEKNEMTAGLNIHHRCAGAGPRQITPLLTSTKCRVEKLDTVSPSSANPAPPSCQTHQPGQNNVI